MQDMAREQQGPHHEQGQQNQQNQQARPGLARTTPPLLPVPFPPQSKTSQHERVSWPGMIALTPPATDARFILQRADDVHALLRMLGNAQTSSVALIGESGAGKSILAALAFRHSQAAAQSAVQAPAQAGMPSFTNFTWLSIGPDASVPDCLAALLGSLDRSLVQPDFPFLRPDQQLEMTLQVLRRPQSNALVVLDQFEELLDLETGQGLPGRGATALLIELFKHDLGGSRVILTCPRSPFGAQQDEAARAKARLVSRVSMPEGVLLLQQRGVQGASQEMSLVWQRCAGNVYGLILFSALSALSGFSLSYLLNSQDYQYVWDGDVTQNLVGVVYNFLNPIQRTLLRALCLFDEPIPLDGILTAIAGEGQSIDIPVFQRELAALLRLALVQQAPNVTRERKTDEKPRYNLHTRIRQHTMEHYLEGNDRRSSGNLYSTVGVAFEPNPLGVNPEARDIALAAGHRRAAAYYAHLAQAQCPPREQRLGVQDVEPLLAVVRHLCLGWHWQQAYDLLLKEGLHDDLARWGAWNTLIRLYTAMISPNGVVARSGEAFICGYLGLLYGRLGEHHPSAFYFQQALDIQREIHDRLGEATTLINQGELLRTIGDRPQARAHFEKAQVLLTEQDDAGPRSALLHNIGLLAQDARDYQQALSYYIEALKLARSQHDPYNQGMILTSTGMLLFEQGRLPEALALLLQALPLRQAARDPAIHTLVLFLMTLEQKMDPDAFAQLLQQARELEV